MINTTLTAGVNWGTDYANVELVRHAGPVTGRRQSSSPTRTRSASPAGIDAGQIFRFDASINYSADQNLLLEGRFLLTYKGSCYTIFLEYRGLDLPPSPRRDMRLVVNLKDIGTLLDVNGSLRTRWSGQSDRIDERNAFSRRCWVRYDPAANEGAHPVRRQGDASAPADLHPRQAARPDRQQAGPLLRRRGDRRGGHPATSASSSATRGRRSRRRSATARASARA